MKKILFLFFAFIFTVPQILAEAVNPEYKQTIITGEVKGAVNEELKVNFCDRFTLGNSSRIVVIDSINNQFYAEYPMAIKNNITILFRNNFINFIAGPGDSIHIKIPGHIEDESFFEKIEFSGANADVNNGLPAGYKYSSNLLRKDKSLINFEIPPQEYFSYIRKIAKGFSDSIEVYCRINNLSEETKDFLLHNLRTDILNYAGYGNKNYDRQEINRLMKELYEDLPFDIRNNNNFISMLHPYVLSVYRNLIISNNKNINKESDIETVIRSLYNNPPGFYKDYIIFAIISDFIEDSGEDFLNAYLPEWEKYLDSEFLINRIKEFISEVNTVFSRPVLEKITTLNSEPEVIRPDTDFISYLQQKHPGKVLYIDVYATWCPPCISEFKQTGYLHEQLKNKEVGFVYVCMDSEEKNWPGFVNKHGIKGDNYYFSGKEMQILRDTYRIQEYPSYFIMDKEGIIYPTQLRPSDKDKLINELESHL
ncbi:MAG: TlpA family protein disulfide reductase [Rikenellaceae bacterium]|nr:TlpA family protein disulfide reductase [Rikenellaceae bacterium]